MLLAIDIGNTNVTIGAFKNDELIFVARLLTESKLTKDQCIVNLMEVFSINHVLAKDFNGAIVSSVVPMLTPAMTDAVKSLIGCMPIIVSHELCTEIDFSAVDETNLGADLIIGSVAAVSNYKLPCIIIDLGTATTVTIINKNKKFLGGCIIPGVKVSLEALTQRASLLPDLSLELPKSLICTDVTDSIRSGLIYGTASMIDGLISKIEADLGYKCTVIATGGLSEMIVPFCNKKLHSIYLAKNLVLYGLLDIYKLNKNCTSGNR